MESVVQYGYDKIRRLADYPMRFKYYKKKVDLICKIIDKLRGGYLTIDEAAKAIAQA